MNKRTILIIVGAIATIALIAVSVMIQQTKNNTGSLDLVVVPSDTTVTLDDKTKLSPGTLSLAAGKHKLLLTRNGFASQTVSLTIVAKKSTTAAYKLDTTDQNGTDYLRLHPEEVAAYEGAAGAAIEKDGAEIERNNPLINLLPYSGSSFTIDVGESEKNPNDPKAVAIYIQSDDEASQTKAINWIKAQGYNPSAYEIIYSIDSKD